jgi:hypothetical protein
MCKPPKDRSAEMARADEQQRQYRIRQGTSAIDATFGQFNDDFFGKQQKNYLDYATPQLEDQYSKAAKELTFSLARSGLTDSSARAQKEAELQKLYDTNRRAVTDQGVSYANDARNNVESARSSLISQLNATGDASGAANSALARASALSQPQAYSPLAQLFTTFTSGLGTQAAAEQAQAYSNGAYKARYNTGLFASPGAVKVNP